MPYGRTALLIAGNATEKAASGHVSRNVLDRRSVSGRKYAGKFERARGDLNGTVLDVKNMQDYYYRDQLSCTVYKAFTKDGTLLKKTEVMNSLKKVFNLGKQLVDVYYSGHGVTYEGDWCFEDSGGNVIEYITFEEIVELWRKRLNGGNNQKLYLICDCCFSGAWAIKSTNNLFSIIVYAACRENQYAFENENGGLFTRDFINQKKSGPLVFERFSLQHSPRLYQHIIMPNLDGAQSPCVSVIDCFFDGQNWFRASDTKKEFRASEELFNRK